MRKLKNYWLMAILALVAVVLAACVEDDAVDTSTTKVESAAADTTKTTDEDSVKVGILHSLSGTMAISEVSLRNAEMMAIDEINAAGGVLGKQIVPVIEDGASDWPTFAEKAKKLLQSDNVATVFGGWTSASRKAMLPVFEQNNGLLWYPVQYEGMESSPNIMYTGATTNQQIVPAVDWLLENKGKKMFLIGSDYVFPRTANNIIKAQLDAKGGELVGEEYTALGHTDYSTLISKIKAADPDVVFNTLNGDSNVAFFKQLKDAGITAKDMPVLSVSIAEEEIRGIGGDVVEGHYTAWNYYQTIDTPANNEWVANFKAEFGDELVTDDPIEAAYFAVYLWAAAAEKAGSFDVAAIKEAAKGIEVEAPGGTVKIDGDNQHTYKVVRIGQIRADGLIDEVWNSGEAVKPDPFLKTYDWAASVSPVE